jgi:hypothetical protein
MLVKVKNHGNSFRTITSGELPTGGVTMVESWEAIMWLNRCDKKIEIIDDHIAEVSKKVEKPKRKKK